MFRRMSATLAALGVVAMSDAAATAQIPAPRGPGASAGVSAFAAGGSVIHPALWSAGKRAKAKRLRLIREGRWKR